MEHVPPIQMRTAGRGRGQSSLEFWEDRPGRNPGPSLVRRDPSSNNFKLHVRSIPPTWDEVIFHNVFSRCGIPLNIYISPRRPGQHLTWGSVEFETYQEAYTAVRELNNNVLVGIQVMFAREKPDRSEFDPLLQILTSPQSDTAIYQSDMAIYQSDMATYQSAESLVDPKTIKKVVKQDEPCRIKIEMNGHQLPVFDADTTKRIQESLFQRILDTYKEGKDATAKCNTCEAVSAFACSRCYSAYYCSENCLNRDWPSHSRNCKATNAGAAEEAMPGSRADHRQSNGHGSFGSERENRFDNKPNRFAPDRRNNREGDRGNRDSDRGFNRDSDRGFNRDSDRGFNKDSDRGFNRDRAQRVEKDGDSQGRRNMVEDRKMMMGLTGKPKSNDNGYNNRPSQNNQRTVSQEINSSKQSTFVRKVEGGSGDWGLPKQAMEDEISSPGLDFINKEKAFLQAAKVNNQEPTKKSEPVVEKPKASPVAAEPMLKPGMVMKVFIIYVEDKGLYWVQTADKLVEATKLCKTLEEYIRTCRSSFSPVQDGVCGVEYEGKWYRCQIRSLSPLTVHYMDFGYPEEVEPSRLFELSAELKALPPFCFKIKLIDGTSSLFLKKFEGDPLDVTLKNKEVNHWLAQVVGDNIAVKSPEALATKTPSVTAASAPTAEITEKPAVVEQAAAVSSPQQSSAAPRSSPPPQPFPSLYDANNFTTVSVTYKQEEDTYYVGAVTVWQTVSEMCQHFRGVIHTCDVITPKHGTMGIAMYMDEWYRVKVVSLSPLLVYFVDFGNVEPLQPGDLKKCPESHKDVPQLVHRIKLAPGTDGKYFNLPDASQISVKPIEWLPDSTIVVQVEGENYTTKTTPSEAPVEPAPAVVASGQAPVEHAPAVVASGQASVEPIPVVVASDQASVKPAPAVEASVNAPVEPIPVVVASSQASVEPAVVASGQATVAQSSCSVQTDVPSRRSSTVDLLQEKWRLSFVPNKVDFVKSALLGQVYCEHVPTTLSFISNNETFQDHLSSQKFDPSFKPSAGEVVGLRVQSGDWERGLVLPQQGLVALNDGCGVTRNAQLLPLTEEYANIPSMAAVYTLNKEDPDLLHSLASKDEVILDVVKVISTNGHTVVHVTTSSISQEPLEGELKTWHYEPLETPDPLMPDDSVTISRVIDSNTLLVAPTNDLEVQQAIQIDCIKSCVEFTTPPKEGDYVAFFDKESDVYFRCRIDKVDADVYTIYAVDDATYHHVTLGDLRHLPTSLRNVPCRITQIELKDVEKVIQTEEAQMYLRHIVEEDKCLNIVTESRGLAILTVEGQQDTLNNKLKEFLKPKVVRDSDGKLTIMSLAELRVQLNQKFDFIVSQTDPLYVQLKTEVMKYYGKLHEELQEHCAKDNAPYNPCESELCLARFEGDWYRCRCLMETNTGVSVLMLVDYGNIFNAPTSDIRRILPEMLTTPSIGISCKIHGLPNPVPPPLKEQLDKLLGVECVVSGVFVAENDGCYEAVFDSVKEAIQQFQ